MTFNNKLIILILISIFMISGCSNIETLETNEYGNMNSSTSNLEFKADTCTESGGNWKNFSNTCVDTCGTENSMCGAAITLGCECGNNNCWNGSSCEAISSFEDRSVYVIEVIIEEGVTLTEIIEMSEINISYDIIREFEFQNTMILEFDVEKKSELELIKIQLDKIEEVEYTSIYVKSN